MLQLGLDVYGQKASSPTVTWQASGGHQDGRKAKLLFFGALVKDSRVTDDIMGYDALVFQETGQVNQPSPSGAVLWGEPLVYPQPEITAIMLEHNYWRTMIVSSCFNGADQTNAPMPCRASKNRFSPLPRRPTGRPGWMNRGHPTR